jgi:hypothetical protein
VKLFRPPHGQVEVVEAASLEERPPAGQLASAQQLVFANAERLSTLMEALDVSTLLGAVSWYTICDGEPQEYMIAFGGDDAVPNAQTLVAELQGAGLTARRSTVAQSAGAERLVAQAQAAASASRRARMRAAG